jgi:hypothetical protein
MVKHTRGKNTTHMTCDEVKINMDNKNNAMEKNTVINVNKELTARWNEITNYRNVSLAISSQAK